MNPLSCLSDNIHVDKSKCVGCGTCVDRCILDNLRLKQAPCYGACPLEINPQTYVQLTARGEEDKALEHLYKRTAFLGILGHICNHPCEKECNRIKVDNEAVTIRAIKKYLHGLGKKPPMNIAKTKNKKVAIIGAGPAGLSAAFDLALAGYSVHIYDENEKMGGMVQKTIPAFRIPSSVIESDVNLLKELPVELHLGHRVDKDEFNALQKEFDAVFVAVGTSLPALLNTVQVDAGAIEGIHYAVNYLENAKKGTAAKGETVVVIGGGDVAVDAAQTAKRNGAKSVRMVSLESMVDLPASAESIEEARREGIEFSCGFGVANILQKANRVQGLEVAAVASLFDKNGAFSPKLDTAITANIECDMLILAIGQKADLSGLPQGICENGKIAVNSKTLQTSLENVFAGGDCVPGANTAVNAMADGKKAAESIMRYLEGDSLTYGRETCQKFETNYEPDLTDAKETKRTDLLAPLGADTLEKTLSQQEAKEQAERCVNCGEPFGMRRTCWLCLPCEVECPYDALEIKVHYIMA